MNELMNELLELNAYASKRLIELNAEVEEIEAEEKLSRKDKKELKELKEDAEYFVSLKENLTKDLEKINALESKITEREDIISKTEDASTKLLHQDKLEELKEEEEALESELRIFYSEDLDYIKKSDETTEETEEVVEETPKKKVSGKKVAISAVALLAAAGLGFGASKMDFSKVTTRMNDKNTKPETTDEQNIDAEKTEEITEITEAKEIDYSKMQPLYDEAGELYGYYDAENNRVIKPEVKEAEAVEITDELIAEVAEEVTNEINTNLPGYGMTVDTIEEMIRWINGLGVENAAEEQQMYIVRQYLALLGKDRDAKDTFKFSKLFLTPNAEKLAENTEKVRQVVVESTGTEKSEEAADLMTELMAKTMNGLSDKEGDKLTNVMDIHRLETASSQLFILLANNYNYATLDNTRDGKYVDKDGFEYYSIQIFEAINNDCVYTYEAETNLGAPGEGHEREALDLLTALMHQTLNEAKEMKDVKTLTLK